VKRASFIIIIFFFFPPLLPFVVSTPDLRMKPIHIKDVHEFTRGLPLFLFLFFFYFYKNSFKFVILFSW